MVEAKSIDITLFGATGFTGQLVAAYLAEVAARTPIRWALAGRNQDKLRDVQATLTRAFPSAPAPELIHADSRDERSLRVLAERTKVVATTVGPYAQFGEPLVKACAEVGTDYTDLTGEPAFVEMTLERYHERARATGAKIVHACGFDSIPHDLGVYFTVKALRRRLRADEQGSAALEVEGVVRARGGFSGGTLHSLVSAMAELRRFEQDRRRRARAQVAHGSRTIRGASSSLHYVRELGYWALPLPTIDPLIVLRSARALPEYGQSFSYGHYAGLRHLHQAVGLAAGMSTVLVLAQLKPTRELLLKLKEPGQGPSPEARAKGFFCVTFLGKAGAQHVRCEVRGGDPGYGDTAKMLSEAALCLALERDKLPSALGVVTTAEGLGEPLLARLQRAGITFAEV